MVHVVVYMSVEIRCIAVVVVGGGHPMGNMWDGLHPLCDQESPFISL